MAVTTAVKKIIGSLESPTFYKVVQGGMSAGKTYAIVTVLKEYCKTFSGELVTVVGMSYPHLRHGAIRDFERSMRETGEWDDSRWSAVNSSYLFANSSRIEFLSVDKLGAHGLRRDVLFVNEANGISWDTFDQLASRTRQFAIVDYNPSSRFWAHDKLVDGEFAGDTTFLRLTYLDNEALSPRERRNIESHRPTPGSPPSNWWTVYGLGEIGTLEGNVYSGWREVPADEIAQGKILRYGLDFGFSNDETALVAIYRLESGELGVVEKFYKTHLLGSQYVDELTRLAIDPSILIVADSARPEIIAEIKRGGFRIVGAKKDAGSVKRGIDYVAQEPVVYAGANLKREYLSYKWRTTRTGESLDEPEDGNDHLLDALRYAVDDLHRPRFDF